VSETKLPNSEKIGFRTEMFEALFEAEAKSFWFRSRNRLVIWSLAKYFSNASSMLEVGCGTGFVLDGISKALPHVQLAGSELYAEGLQFAQKRLPGVNFKQLDARNLPFSEAYDVIGAFDVLEHIEEDELVLRQLFKACRKGIVITVPQHDFLWSAVDELACHKRRYSAQEIKNKVERAGFRVVRMTSFVSILLPLMFISRMKTKNPEKVVGSEFNLPKVVDRLFEAIINFECRLVAAGVTWPFGGSLLVVAEKK